MGRGHRAGRGPGGAGPWAGAGPAPGLGRRRVGGGLRGPRSGLEPRDVPRREITVSRPASAPPGPNVVGAGERGCPQAFWVTCKRAGAARFRDAPPPPSPGPDIWALLVANGPRTSCDPRREVLPKHCYCLTSAPHPPEGPPLCPSPAASLAILQIRLPGRPSAARGHHPVLGPARGQALPPLSASV